MTDNAILQSFELAGELAGDISPRVYEAYFARCPESRDVMQLVDQYMRGRMLESVMLMLMDDSAEGQRDYIRFEARNHVSYGALPHMYENLLAAVRDTIRDALGAQWTQSMEAAWLTRLDDVLREIRAVA